MGSSKLGILFFVCLSACASVSQPTHPDKIYRRDMVVTVNGQRANGVLVVPKSETYEFQIEARGKLDMLILKSCHEHRVVESVKESGIFGSRRKTRFSHTPGSVELNKSACPVELGGFEKSQGRHSWALVDFENPDLYKLKATLYCNGETLEANGVSICQSQIGLIQRLIFNETVEIASNEKSCEIPKPQGEMLEWKVRGGVCVYNFLGKSSELHRLTTIGYEEIIVRGEGE